MDLTRDEADMPDQLLCLRDLYGSTISGKVSTPHRVPGSENLVTLRKSKSYELFETKYHADLAQEENARTGKISDTRTDWQCDATGAKLGTGTGQTPTLWLNLSDGFIGGGRKQTGARGNDAALQHYRSKLDEGKHYPLCVKLGTITAEGANVLGDVYSYAEDEDDSVLVPPERLAELLWHWGIDTLSMEKTEENTQEIELGDLEESFFRNRHRIPRAATHYVHAYQLAAWTVDDKFKRLDELRQDSGEISLASFGGFIYFSSGEREKQMSQLDLEIGNQ